MSDSQDFDPRFDPAFQRGFAGEVTTTRRRGIAGAPSVTPAAGAPAAPPSGVAPLVEAPLDEPDPVEPADEVPPTLLAAPAAVRLVTPWTIAIAVVGVLLILGGAYGINQLIEGLDSADQTSTTGFYVVLMGLFAGPLAIALGLACLIGLLFLGAVSKRGTTKG